MACWACTVLGWPFGWSPEFGVSAACGCAVCERCSCVYRLKGGYIMLYFLLCLLIVRTGWIAEVLDCFVAR